MQSKRVYPYKNNRDIWVPTFWENNTMPTLPSGKTFTFTSVTARPLDYYVNKGLPFQNINEGTDQYNQYPANNKAMFLFNPEFLKNSNPNKPLRDFSQAECNTAVDSFLSGRSDLKILTSGAGEAYGGLEPWSQSTVTFYVNNDPAQGTIIYAAPQQYEWIDRRFSQQMRSRGQRYYGQYDGHVGTGGFLTNSGSDPGDSNKVRSALQNGSLAYNMLKNNTASGYGNPYFQSDHYTFRDGLINTYWGGSTDSFKRITQILIGFALNRKALDFRGNTDSRTMSFMFAGKTEFAGYLTRYRHDIASGYVENLGFPQYSAKLNLILAYISLAFCDDLFGWEDTALRGLDPNIITDNNQYTQYYGSGNPQRANTFGNYIVGRSYAYFESVFGSGNDAMCEGVSWYARASSWAGATVVFARTRISGTQTWSPLGDTHILDCYQQGLPLAILHSSGARRALFFFDLANSPGTSKTYEIDILGSTFSLSAEGGVPYLYLFDQV